MYLVVGLGGVKVKFAECAGLVFDNRHQFDARQALKQFAERGGREGLLLPHYPDGCDRPCPARQRLGRG